MSCGRPRIGGFAIDYAHTCVCASGVRPALTCEDAAVSGKKKAGKKRALTDKSKKAAVKKPMSKAQGKKKAVGKNKASSSAALWGDSSDEEGAHRPVVTAVPVVGVDGASDSDESPPYDEDLFGPAARADSRD